MLGSPAMSWHDYWYPALFGTDLVNDRPLAVVLVDQPLVLFRAADGEAVAVDDRCPHRSTPLSLGRVVDGQLECAYHGWQFGAGGHCTHIPTLAAKDQIPRKADARARAVVEHQGMVWVWMGDPEQADRSRIPTHPELESPGWACVDMMNDFEIDHGLMIENLLDPSHLPFTHENTLAKRRDAQPLDVQVQPAEGGFVGITRRTRKPRGAEQRFTFDPPCGVRLDLVVRPGWELIQIHYCVPLQLGQPRMRLFSRMVRNWLVHVPGMDWMTRRGSRRILDQDTAMLIGQQDRLDAGAVPWNCPVAADRMAVAYRQWRTRLEGSSAV